MATLFVHTLPYTAMKFTLGQSNLQIRFKILPNTKPSLKHCKNQKSLAMFQGWFSIGQNVEPFFRQIWSHLRLNLSLSFSLFNVSLLFASSGPPSTFDLKESFLFSTFTFPSSTRFLDTNVRGSVTRWLNYVFNFGHLQ